MVKIAQARVEQTLALLRSGVTVSEIAANGHKTLPAVTQVMQRHGREQYRQAMIAGLYARLERLLNAGDIPGHKRLASHAHDRYPDVFPSVRRPSKAQRRAVREVNAMDIRQISGK